MTQLSTPPLERSRNAHCRVLQALQRPGTQAALATAMGVSESTISRIKTEKLEDAVALLYQLGFKVVSEDRVCVKRVIYESMVNIAQAAMACEDTSRKLIWEED